MLERVVVDEAVRELRPDFAVLVMTAEGPANGGGGQEPEGWLAEAGDLLAGRLRVIAPDVRIASRLIGGR